MNYELVFVLWFVLMVVTGVIGAIQMTKGIRHNSNKHFWRGLLSLAVCFVLLYVAWQFVSGFKKIGG
ncbi:hypothetical protein [Polluticoccus soli]|uniref:hypothetical protein n=1 Tax=Polluticoccus soli TaxID=3034150 RepID=UPI0023E31D06|nr:hypothetical protein [Flavipsychrobacter sp. JY13-12]